MKIEYTYSKGIEVNYATATSEKQYLRAKKRLEKKGWKVEKLYKLPFLTKEIK